MRLRELDDGNTHRTLDDAVTFARTHERREAYVVAAPGRVEVQL